MLDWRRIGVPWESCRVKAGFGRWRGTSKRANSVNGGCKEAFVKVSWKMFHASDKFFGDLFSMFHGREWRHDTMGRIKFEGS